MSDKDKNNKPLNFNDNRTTLTEPLVRLDDVGLAHQYEEHLWDITDINEDLLATEEEEREVNMMLYGEYEELEGFRIICTEEKS